MKNNTTFLLIIGCIAMIILAILFAMKLQKNATPSVQPKKQTSNAKQIQLEEQEVNGGNVSVTVKPEVLQVGEKPRFMLTFNTHSEELDFDVSKVSTLIDSDENTYSESMWEGTPAGGHHRNGVLIFNEPLKETSNMTLVISNVAGIEKRVFKWSL